jgi:uncharacterized membrane protein YqaE (UPF0057 family)
MVKTILLILITIFRTSPHHNPHPFTPKLIQPPVPPVGVFLVAGCGMDLLINLCLTLLGFLPGHVHAFYLEYVYVKRRDEARAGIYDAKPAPGVYSAKVQRGGRRERDVGVPVPAQQGYGTVA